MWTTADGQVLKVPGFRLREWAEARKRGSSGTCACDDCVGRAVAELEAELGELIGRARRVGTAVGRRSGRRLPIFRATRGRRPYRIFARPLFGNQHTIVAVTPEPAAPVAIVEPEPAAEPEEPPVEEPANDEPTNDGEDLEVPRGPLFAWIDWSAPMSLADAQKRSNWPAVYIVEANDKPVYVGQTFNVPERMKTHERDYAAGVDAAGRWPKPANIKVRIGRIVPKPRNTLEIVEHAVVRTLQPTPHTVLENRSPLDAIKATGNITIGKILPDDAKYASFRSARAPKVQNGSLKLAKNDSYELFHDVRIFG